MYGGFEIGDPSEAIWSKPNFIVEQTVTFHMRHGLDPLPHMEYRHDEYERILERIIEVLSNIPDTDYENFRETDDYKRIDKMSNEIIKEKSILRNVIDKLKNGLIPDGTISLKGDPWFNEISNKIDLVFERFGLTESVSDSSSEGGKKGTKKRTKKRTNKKTKKRTKRKKGKGKKRKTKRKRN